MICLYGWDAAHFAKEVKWLEEDPKRRMIWIQEGDQTAPEHPQVGSYLIQSPLQAEIVAREVAWQAVFSEIHLVEGVLETFFFSRFKAVFEACHMAAGLLLSDASDFGVRAVKNCYANRKRAVRSIFDLEGSFRGIPAIIAGAGPSLPPLASFEKKALIFAGGAALDRLDITPHFAGSIDKEGPLKKIPSKETPFCFQSRLNEDVLSQVQGPLLLAPETHFDFLRWLEGEKMPFDAGWTVGNFLAALAALWGCNPIIFVGMDYSYRDGKKYAQDELPADISRLVEAENLKGEKILTQRDWIMAARWMGELAERYSDQTFIDGCGGGLDLGSSVAVKRLDRIDLPQRDDLREIVKKSLSALKKKKRAESRWTTWMSELELGSARLEEMLLEPLWRIWKPVFAREVETEEQLNLHRSLLFERIRREHLDALSN